jgi:hypothetical protein
MRPAAAKPQEPVKPAVEAAVVEEAEVLTVAAPETEAPEPSARRRPIDVIDSAKRQLKELTGYPVDSVSGFAKSEDGWALRVTVVELSRIPAATDVLAEYVADLDTSGDIIGYRRGRRFYRNDVGDPE